MSEPWTHTRSRLANAGRRLRVNGPTPDAMAQFKRAQADHAAARLEFAISDVHARGICLGASQRLRLIELLGATPGRDEDDKAATASTGAGSS